MLLSIISAVFLSFLSYIFRRPVGQYSLSIGRISISNLTLYDVTYSGVLYNGTYHFTFVSESIFIRFHLPTYFLPRWLTFTSEAIFYTSETGDISTDKLSATLWIFPVVFRQTAGPWSNIEIDGLKIRVPAGRHTPFFIKKLRENLVGAVICGEIYRVDDFGTKLTFSGLTEGAVEEDDEFSGTTCNGTENRHQNGNGDANGGATVNTIGSADGRFEEVRQDGDIRPKAEPYLRSNQDEICISAFVRGLHLHNTEGRIYTFGAIDAQFRRNWSADRGSFVGIAKESRWIRVHWPYQRTKVTSAWAQLLGGMVMFPYHLIHVLRHPITTANLYVTRLDITFDDFRLRDAELLMQGIALLEEKMFLHDIDWRDVIVDAVTKGILASIS